MIPRKITFLACCMCLCWAGLSGVAATAQGALYVVDSAAPNAADDNPGSEQSPLKTVQHAANIAHAGDTVCVVAGDYAQRVALKNSGTADRPIIFRACPRRSAKILGFSIGTAAYLRIEGFDITAPKSRTPGIEIGGDHVEVLDNFLHDLGLAIGPAATGQPAFVEIAYNDVYQCQQGIWAGGNHWIIECNHVHRATWMSVWGDADYTRVFGTDQIVRYNTFDGSKTSEIGRAHLDCIQVFDSNGEIAQRTEVCYNVEHDFHEGLMGECNKTKDNVSDWTFHNNIASCPAQDGFVEGAWGLCSVQIPGLKAINNTYYSIKWNGVGITGKKADGGLIRNNLFVKIDEAMKTTGAAPTQDHNLIFQCGKKDVSATGNLLDVDPMMVDPQHGNYRLQKGSPAIGAGEGGATIGALEYPNVYYVDPRHPAATDDGFGYAGEPFKTLAKAMAVAQTGQTVILRGGVYREDLIPAADGVTIRAMTGEKVTISGADEIAGWKRDGNTWSAPLAAAPVKVLLDGQPWTDFTYDPAAKTITLKTPGDPRVHLFETIVRHKGIDTAARKDVKVEGITAVNEGAAG